MNNDGNKVIIIKKNLGDRVSYQFNLPKDRVEELVDVLNAEYNGRDMNQDCYRLPYGELYVTTLIGINFKDNPKRYILIIDRGLKLDIDLLKKGGIIKNYVVRQQT